MNTTRLPTIGNRPACSLHKFAAQLGVFKNDNLSLLDIAPSALYALAAALCEPFALAPLTGPTEEEARTVWRHLCRMYPSAAQVAA